MLLKEPDVALAASFDPVQSARVVCVSGPDDLTLRLTRLIETYEMYLIEARADRCVPLNLCFSQGTLIPIPIGDWQPVGYSSRFGLDSWYDVRWSRNATLAQQGSDG